MTRQTLLASVGGVILGGFLFNAAPALADLPVIDFGTDTILQLMQTALTNAITSMTTSVTNALTDLTNPASVSSLLTAGFTQNANYSKAQVSAQQQIADASNTSMARFDRDMRNSEIRDQQTPNVQSCAALDSGQVVTAASLQGWRTSQTIGGVMDPRGEALIGTPAYYGEGQAMQAAGQVHLSRYCSTTEAAAGLCTTVAPALQNADQRAASLFGTDNLIDQNGVNAANDFGTNLIQPIVPAALRGDQLTSVNGQDASARRREYNARMSLARSAIDLAIGQQAPGVTLTAQQQQLLTNEGLTPPASGSWLQSLSLEVTRRISDVSWAAGLQAMPPASVEREIATELALSNYLALQNYRVTLLNATIGASQLAATEEGTFKTTTPMPSPSIASN